MGDEAESRREWIKITIMIKRRTGGWVQVVEMQWRVRGRGANL